MMVGENLQPRNGLNENDRIFITISGSRPGQRGGQAGPVEISRGAFDYQGRAVDMNTGQLLGPNVQGLELKVADLPAYPEFPCDAVDKATPLEKARLAKEYAAKVEQINRAAGAGRTIEDAILDAVVHYCVNYLGFSEKDAPDRFVVKKRELALTKQIIPTTGGSLYTVRHAARFGL